MSFRKVKSNLKVWLTGATDKVTTSTLEYLSWRNQRLKADLESGLNSIPK